MVFSHPGSSTTFKPHVPCPFLSKCLTEKTNYSTATMDLKTEPPGLTGESQKTSHELPSPNPVIGLSRLVTFFWSQLRPINC